LITVTDWDGLTTAYTYDKAGRTETVSLPNGVLTNYDIDGAGQLLTLTHSLGEQILSSYSYVYDEVGNRLSVTESQLQPEEWEPEPPIFADGFEVGDLTAWSESVTDGGDLSVITQTALVNDFSLQANLDDNNALYVVDYTPDAAARYRARFYFDPNSIAMANNNSHYIFQATDAGTNTLFYLNFRYNYGDYQVQAVLINDAINPTWTYSDWYTITDQFHYLEIDWRSGTGDGRLYLWIDGVRKATLTGISNNSHRVERVQLGAVSGIDTGTRGIYYFDAFESRSETYIGPDPDAPTPPVPSKPDLIFEDDFETGNISSWTESIVSNGQLSVTLQSAISGTYGLQATVIDYETNIGLIDWSPSDETRYRARFYLDPNSIQMGNDT
jgi:YD repeat-containing protein